MSTRDRMKAMDVFREKDFVFSEKVPMPGAYPEIEQATLEVLEQGHSEGGCSGQPRLYRWLGFGEFINCSHSDCYNGGFSVGNILREMISARTEAAEKVESCQGYEGSPKGRRRYRSCIHRFSVKVHIDYKPVEQS